MSQNFPTFTIGQLFLGGQTGVTAYPSGTQINSTKLYGSVAILTTVATAGDGVKLPPCKSGSGNARTFLLVNDTATAATVFSNEATGVTINGTAGATGVSLPAGAAAWFVVAANGASWIGMLAVASGAGSFTTLAASGAVSGAGFTALFASPPAIGGTAPALGSFTFYDGSIAVGLTAVGTNRGNSLALTKQFNVVAIAASSAVGVTLPSSATVGVGGFVRVYNDGPSNAFNVYAAGSDTIDGTAGSTGVVLTNAFRCDYVLGSAGAFLSYRSAIVRSA